MSRTYRPCVIGVFVDKNGLLLSGERFDGPGVWQFPQGGIEVGEDPEDALYREMKEELGSNAFEILKAADGTTPYDFPEDLDAPIAIKYKGQRLHWFLIQFRDGEAPNLDSASDKEFSNIKWVNVETILDEIINWKLDAYTQGLRMLGLVGK